MSPQDDPRYYSCPSPTYCEGGSESPVTRQPGLPEQSWPSTASTSGPSDYSRPHQTLDPAGSSFEVHDGEGMNYYFNFSGSSYSLPAVSSHNPGVGTNATFTNDAIPSQAFMDFRFNPYGLGHDFSELQHYAPYVATQSSVYYTPQSSGQDISTSQAPFASSYPYSSSTSLPQVSEIGPVCQTDAGLARSTPGSLTLGGAADTAQTDAGAGQHSHPAPVVASSANRSSTPGPSRPPPSSPERKRLLPLPDADELSTGRRVVPRRDRGSSVHSASSAHLRRSRSNSTVPGRGPLVPQERYTTSTISSYSAPDQHPVITFNLENPNQIGIPIIDILNKADGYTRILDRTRAFDMMKKTFTLRVQWPGYGPWAKTIAAMDWKKTRGPITRVKLAEAVATAIRDLFEKYREKRYDTDYERWNVGPNGIQLNEICLVSLHHVSRGSWQPELCLLGPRR